MIQGGIPSDDFLVGGVLGRRLLAGALDLVIVGILVTALWTVLFVFGILTLGFGFTAMAVLPAVPVLYNFLSILSSGCATPGQRLMGLEVRREHDFGPPTVLQAVIWIVVYYATLATSGLLLLVALFTRRNRTLHDILSGLIVVRGDALDVLTTGRGAWTTGLLHDL